MFSVINFDLEKLRLKPVYQYLLFMIYCSSCGTVLQDHALFCPECGTKTEKPETVSVPVITNTTVPERAIAQEQNSVVSSTPIVETASSSTQAKQYCRNCGKEVPYGAYGCTGCVLPPMKGSNYFHNCGVSFHTQAVICIKCGVNLENRSQSFVQNTVTQSQPNQSSDLFPPQLPKTWLAESILATLFCCLPFGIVGIINASKIQSHFNAGNYDAAQRASDEAKKWTMISFWIGIIGALIWILVYVAALTSYDY